MSALLSYETKPMEAEPIDELPSKGGWQFEPKYDGFRCLAFRNGEKVELRSKTQKSLTRFFPEVVTSLQSVRHNRFVLDGELIMPDGSFETLQLRLHPASTRIALMAERHPAEFVAFDILDDGRPVLDRPLPERRAALVALFADMDAQGLTLGVATTSPEEARNWLGLPGIDGVMAKELDAPYRPGKRAMRKYKVWKTIDCVVAGVYFKEGTRAVDSLLLGLYDEDGNLNYVGRSRVYHEAKEMGQALEAVMGGSGFTGRTPGGISRWSGKERKPVPLRPVLVAEVSADHITGDYMRHGARLLRWRTDKRPEDCTMDQVRSRARETTASPPSSPRR